MKLEYIRLRNFRQFYGNQEAEFSPLADLNVTVFHGSNGAGKTSLFSAVNWCLYGKGVDEIGELASKEALVRAPDGGRIETSVAIAFVHQRHRYIATRTLYTIKSGTKTKAQGAPEFSLVRITPSGDSISELDPNIRMNQILPENVRSYFFFDGEKMDDLTRANSKEVADAVRNVMRLPALERAQEHLDTIAREYRSELRSHGSPELERLIEREDALRTEKADSQKRRDELRNELGLAEDHISDLQARLRDKEGAKQLQTQRDQAQEYLQKQQKLLDEKLQDIQLVVNRSFVSLLPDAVEKALRLLDEKREKGEIPSGIREQFIEDLLDKGICVCGRPFAEHDDAHHALTSMLRKASSGELETIALRLAGNLRAMSTTAQNQTQRLQRLMREKSSIEEITDDLQTRLEDIKHQLSRMPEEDIAGLERQLGKFQRDRDNYIAQIGALEERLRRIDGEIDAVRRKKDEAEAKERRSRLMARKESLAQRSADAIGRIKEEFFEYSRVEIEKATKEVFSTLAWKQEHFQDIQLDSSFRLEVIDRWGLPTRQELSAGERQILSLAFICAMVKVSGEDAPLVMDTPFGRLSGNHLSAVAENLPGLASQLVLFVTDREWDEASRTRLEPRTGAQYELRFDRKTGCTEIIEKELL